MAPLAPSVRLVSSGTPVLLVQPPLPTVMTVHKMDLPVHLVLQDSMVKAVLHALHKSAVVLIAPRTVLLAMHVDLGIFSATIPVLCAPLL